jgi:hypothetical protein
MQETPGVPYEYLKVYGANWSRLEQFGADWSGSPMVMCFSAWTFDISYGT